MSFQVIDTIDSVAKLADSILNLPVSPPSLYIDLEGINLCRHGSISIVTLYVLPSAAVYIIDVHKLGAAAFFTEGDAKQSFKATLESQAIPKVFFDVRNDSDALHSLFQVKLSGVQDVQLMELAARDGSQQFLMDLADCILEHADLEEQEELEWTVSNYAGKEMFDPQMGGSYEVFNERPLKPNIVDYCAQDVRLLARLWRIYNFKLDSVWRAKVAIEIYDRIIQSQSAGYDPQGKHMALGPRGWTFGILESRVPGIPYTG